MVIFNKNILFREKVVNSFLELLKGNNCALHIAKKSDITYSHWVKVLKQCEKNEILTREKIGRKKELVLTKKGYEIMVHIKEIYKILGYEEISKPLE